MPESSYNPLVSILIPCYNAEPWIKQSIQSALDQTWPNKEVIVVDDGSTDASAEIIRTFDDQIQFHQASHSGGNPVRNQLTGLARGEWLQYLDADDYLMPGKIASQLARIGPSEADVDVVYSPVIILDMLRQHTESIVPITENDETLTFIRWGPLNTGGLLLKRSAVQRVGCWKEDQACCQEHELLLRLQFARCRFLLHNQAETVYRRYNSTTVSTRDPLLTISTRMELTDKMEEYLKASGKLRAAHIDALFAARLECARSVYRENSRFAHELYNKAVAYGHKWVTGSPALPISYQLTLRVSGFMNAERLAARVRGRHSDIIHHPA